MAAKQDHVPGGNLLDPVLEELAAEPGGFLKSATLGERLRARFALHHGPDADALAEGAEGALNERLMALVTEAWRRGGASGEALARYVADDHGWHITRKGRDLITGVR